MADMLVELLKPIVEIGPDVSGSVYKLPASVKTELILGIVCLEPQLKAIMSSGKAKALGASEGGEGLIAIGGYLEPDLLVKIHNVLMSVGGVEFVVGMGPGSARLPKTEFGRAAAGAHARSMSASKPASKPWWKLW